MLPTDFKPRFGELRKRLRQLSEHFNITNAEQFFENTLFENTVDNFARFIKVPRGNPRSNLRSSLIPYYGRTLTIATRHAIIWRMAAGWDRLVAGKRLAAQFEASNETFWTGLTIEDIRIAYTPDPKRKPRYAVSFRIHHGKYAGLLFTDYISTRWFRFRLGREIGFPRFKPLHYMQLVNCVFIGEIDLQNPQHPKLVSFEATTSVQSQTARLRKLQHAPCIRGFPWPCHKCPVGNMFAPAGEVPCHRGQHTHTYIKRECQQCGQESYFDPSGQSMYACLVCQLNDVRRREKSSSE